VARTLRRLGIAGVLRRRGASVKGVNALAPGQVRMTATLQIAPTAPSAVVVLRGRRSFAEAGEETLRLKLARRGSQMLAGRPNVRLTLRASFTDETGHGTRAPGRTVVLGRNGPR
jgi:hypothetical protein